MVNQKCWCIYLRAKEVFKKLYQVRAIPALEPVPGYAAYVTTPIATVPAPTQHFSDPFGSKRDLPLSNTQQQFTPTTTIPYPQPSQPNEPLSLLDSIFLPLEQKPPRCEQLASLEAKLDKLASILLSRDEERTPPSRKRGRRGFLPEDDKLIKEVAAVVCLCVCVFFSLIFGDLFWFISLLLL